MALAKPAWPVLQSGHPLARGLIGAWPFYEGAGSTLNDLSGNRNSAAFQSAPPWVGGQFGSALSFNGSTQYVDAGTPPSLNPSAVTVSAWIKASAFSNAYNAVVSKVSADFQAGHTILIKSTGKIALYIGATGSVNYDGTGINTLSAGTWYHIVLTYDSISGLKGYLNGALDGSAAANGPLLSNSGRTLIGSDPATAGRNFPGLIDGVLIYNRVLSAAEAAALYFDPFAIYRPRTRHWMTPFAAAAVKTPSTLPMMGAGLVYHALKENPVLDRRNFWGRR